MAARNDTRARESQIAFDALSIEGGLLSPEWLSKIAQLTAGTQSEADYRIPKGLNLRDEIGRYWRIAQAHWADFNAGRNPNTGLKGLSERFVTSLLREGFGFSSLMDVESVILAERSYPIGRASLAGRVPVVIAPAGSGLDALLSSFGDGGRRRSAFGLAQEYLNTQDGALWGVACDGIRLRIVRDNASLTRPAWIEADLARIFTEERYADFTALWLLLHETRFGRDGQLATDCALETWRSSGREEGTRAREHLRRGVEEALLALGQGFLAHPENQALRASLQNGTLQTRDYFNQLLRLVYRLIFLLTVEERGLLQPDDATNTAKTLYTQGYGLRRLRERSVKRNAHDRFADLWEATKIVFQGVANGEPRLGLPALAGIFAAAECAALDAAKLENRALLLAVFKLAWLRVDGSLSRVNWRDMGPEELGSVYESLLELVPQVTQDGRQFAFAAGGETKGNSRKTTGSYYTPDSLVQVLLDSALDPVIADTLAKNPENPADALLGLSVVDPACGSGHFLLAAARRLASHVARLQANGTPSAAEYRHAMRQVVGRCIYGVDLNLMAVELCKVSLWMEAVEPGLPLTFLNSHIQHGNALLGTTPELMTKGIPDAAWEPIEGDNKKTATAIKKRNKAEAGGQRTLNFPASALSAVESRAVARAVAELEAASDVSFEALTKKESEWNGIIESSEYRHQKFVADAWCAAFVWPKQPGYLDEAAPTNEVWRAIRDASDKTLALTNKIVVDLARQHHFFHWHLQFPQVFAKGGFDVVLGNPPWERLTLRDQEWFASRDPDVASAKNAADRRNRIQELQKTRLELFNQFRAEKRASIGEKVFSRVSDYFPLSGVGDVNTFALFAETAQRFLSTRGHTGLIVPTGVATTDTTKVFFASLVKGKKLRALYDFDNRGGLFPAVQGNVRFCLLITGGSDNVLFRVAAQLTRTSELNDPERVYELSAEDIERINPGTLTCPLFITRHDAAIVDSIYRRTKVLQVDEGIPTAGWRVSLSRMLHMGDDAEDFRTEQQLVEEGARFSGDRWIHPANGSYLPLYESKLCDQYNHRAATFDGIPQEERFGTHPATRPIASSSLANPSVMVVPRYWAQASKALEWAGTHRLLLAFRNAVSATADTRSLNACLMPVYPAGDSIKFISAEPDEDLFVLVALFNSFVLDFVFRQKATGANASFFLIRQLPFLSRESVDLKCEWDAQDSVRSWIVKRVRELSCTSNDMCFASVGAGVFVFDDNRRVLLRAEIDAAVMHLYGLDRDTAAYVLDSFSAFRRADEAVHSEYRTKRLILEIYDAIAEGAQTGKPYQTRLDPPPSDLRVAHSLSVLKLPAMPDLIPSMLPEDEAGLLIWALMHANGGAMLRSDLARAFALRSQPNLLVRLAPPALSQAAQRWASKVPHRAVAPGLLAAKLRELSTRSGVELTTDASSHSVVKVSSYTGADSNIDPWFRFEARLALHVLRSQPELAVGTIDASVAGDDRALLA